MRSSALDVRALIRSHSDDGSPDNASVAAITFGRCSLCRRLRLELASSPPSVLSGPSLLLPPTKPARLEPQRDVDDGTAAAAGRMGGFDNGQKKAPVVFP
mmetsp:Transcript_28906/g.67823  ORF Transcript_28906/g.67823 Transcript_28906/m.67823 type:complete len:100 (-) Transcript_28906:20-319(-)